MPVIQTPRLFGRGAGLQFFFSAPWASVWSKIKGGAVPPRVPPLDPPLGRKDGVEIVGDVWLKSFEKARAFLTERLPRIAQNNR